MGTRKTKANGAAPASDHVILEEVKSKTKTSNGSQAAKVPKIITSEFDGLIDQRQLLAVLSQVKNGNFAIRVSNDQVGVTGKIYDTLNDIIALNEILVQELNQARKIIGKQGKLNHRVELPRLAGGSWSTAVDSINSLISDLVHPTIEIAHVISSVAKGNLSQEMPLKIGDHLLQGEFARIASEVNDMVKQLNLFSMEVTRVAREVGSEGKLGGQAKVKGVAGVWKDLTDSVNQMAGNLTAQVRNIAEVTTAVAKGDLSKKITVDVQGEILELKNTINTMVDQLNSFSSEVTRVAREVGTDGKLGGQAEVPGVAGTWKDLTDSVNQMASNLTGQVRNIAEVTTAVARGDLSRKITVDVKGEILELKNTINTMVDQLNSFSAEVTRVAREVGSEGKLGGQATVKGVGGVWKDLTDNVNQLAGNLTVQLRDVSKVATAIANGDLTQKITVDVKGEILQIKDVINRMVDQLNSFASEVTRVALEVGTEGKLGGQAKVQGVGGTWKDLTDSVNQMASNLTAQVRNIAEVTTAVANGDLSKKITVDVAGEILELKKTINTMVDQLNSFASEVTRVALEVGTEGKLGGQAKVQGVGGTWKDLTESVNQMASNLTAQVRNIAEVTTAVAKGDLSRKITVDVKGEILELKNTINTMVDQLNSFGSEVTRVAREVGSEGMLGGQADVPGVEGLWKDLTDSVNKMASNLTGQVRNIAEVTTAVANGDLSRKIEVDVKGEILELKNTINTMVEQLRAFASEVTRVAREVGTEGKLGGQANVPGVGGTWKDLTDSVNGMAGNLTAQVRNIADVAIAVANGDMSKKITVDVRGEILQLKETLNTMVDQLRAFASEVTRVAREVGSEGKLGGQAFVPGVAGTWKDLTDSVNQMTGNLTLQVRNIAEVTKAVASGDLSKKVTIDVKGEILDLKNTINTMVDQLNSFAFEVTRVAREVGTEGKLGGQAEVQGVAGTWKDLTDSVNMMASNLTNQVRGIAKVVTAVATGNLKQKLSIVSRGEVAQLTETINEMIDTLAVFADQVTTVAREVGVEGRLGGQASVPGASGIWKNLTENVNQLAENLTTQVRAISEVASAVTKGDLTRMIRVEAKGEVEELKDTINQMIANLKETTLLNQEQDWLKSNLAKFTQMLQGQKDLNTVTRRILSELAQVVNAQQGMFYILEQDENEQNKKLKLFSAYAFNDEISINKEFSLGQGLVGQVAVQKERILLNNVPKDYIRISSGLGESSPASVIVLPVLFETEIKAVIELASFDEFSETHLDFLGQLTESIGIVLNTIEANSRTEELLEQSQSLTEELRRTNEELQDKAHLLVKQKEEVEAKNKEVEDARKSLEEKAEQLQLTSKYKSEFLANMSHELRTPLNSLLILAQQLYENREGNLSEKQVRYAKTIHSCGDDLIQLINDILDLSKIESGYISTDFINVRFNEITSFVETTFKHVSESKNLKFGIEVDSQLPDAMETDVQRLNQILKNLLSNAFKFTEKGGVQLRIYDAKKNWKPGNSSLDNARRVVAFEIKDSGIGISKDKQNIIFEAFQQAEGSTSRKYGGTGLGLSISRGLADLLGGSIELESESGSGSTFTLFLPISYNPSIIKKEKQSSLTISEYKLAETSEDMSLQSVPTIKVEAKDLEGLNEIINETGDDRNNIYGNDRAVLVVEDDLRFAKIMIDKAHEMQLKVVVAGSFGEVFELTNKYNPIAVTLDVKLPDASGWRVLDLFKNDINFRHIPVHLISGEENRLLAMQRGARSFNLKPLKNEDLDILFKDIVQYQLHKPRHLLIVEDNQMDSSQIARIMDNGELIDITIADTGKQGVELIANNQYDCIIVDYMLPDINGLDFVKEINNIKRFQMTPVLIYSAKDFSPKEKTQLKQYANRILLKDFNSMELLLEEAVLHMHIDHKDMLPEKQMIIENLRSKEDVLTNKTILVVDDDVRNLFALTTAFERYNINTITAESGQEAINILMENPSVDMVLMDIMMPEMDGYETTQKIRREHKNNNLPIIAVTAKAMKGDREKCIEAGASDYITKPVKIDQLLSLMRVWLYK
ncbi:HAMP domain-containing protein [Flavisolibacter ginsengisoli]|jgi:HAMP domain-containing protein/signal transduction histidine kinase/CheY-like chemotaxis protein|uniref:histidine kinase n=1 Tax=Flavisolibacter ginsengisoli DSM 18119 TaxID=1121884 RepID=A0A1M4WTK6_9BACT|nr:HAMP domain-containing protein [Flavisolibacter ginsengisoli]SHE84544.1 Signal transduction histidine kinase [Flavisolibacter ginsengisoli DSM 18119]